ncbi:MAG TPA: VWA domain-containing protein [Candidatus Anammoximicrobium sp.]|nr:VWA domain-containing protein [Candidatus Anammoximicrobium sp.]
MTAPCPLLAAETASTFYQFARLQAMSQWWHWLVLVAVCAAVLTFVAGMYRKDSVELTRGLTWALVALRLLAFASVLFYFFNLEKRTERQLVKNSRVVLLVDTSQSMGLQDGPAPDGSAGMTRIRQVVDELAQGPLLEQLRRQHDVVVYRFDQTSRPTEVASFAKRVAAEADSATVSVQDAFRRSLGESRRAAAVAGLALFLGVFFVLVLAFVVRRSSDPERGSWTLSAGVFALILGLVVLAVGNLRNPDVTFPVMIGWRAPVAPDSGADRPADARPAADPSRQPQGVDWEQELAARGLQTRLGDAVRYLVNKERGGPIAGLVVFTDGRRNEGVEHTAAAALARLAEIAIYPVGLGSDRRPANIRVVDLEAPERVYPGDRFTLTGYVQANGMPGRSVEVRLSSAPTGVPDREKSETVEQEDRVELGSEGEIVAVKFEVTPDEAGRRTYQLAIKNATPDSNPRDDFKAANVEVVDRKTRVLLIAGGPSREYQFLRNMLYRDKDVASDVWLQTGVQGISQEADELLFEFPETTEDLFEYDCIVAFDPDWTLLDLLQIKNLEQWVADKAGGLIVVAGPVHTPQWANVRQGDSRLDTIRALYPVVFYSSGLATLGVGRFGGEEPWPLQFAREGLEAEFLWLEDTAVTSEAAWASFDGVFGYYAVKDPKPAARVYARFSDPNTAIDGQLPIYLASHFYGAGRVFFQASGEMWRLRTIDEAYFERYYTKLIRWAAQGRLLQDSRHGVLLVDKDRCLLGDTVAVQAVLTDAQGQPLSAAEQAATLTQPDESRVKLTLKAVQGGPREGTFAGQFTAVQEGDYRVELRPPQGELDELLVREIRVLAEELEIKQPERNDPLLLDMAQTSGGAYYVGIEPAMGRSGSQPPLVNVLQPQDQVTYLPGLPDPDFERRLMGWLMALICGALSLEWLLRRLSRLA